jgi:hypothetical protein
MSRFHLEISEDDRYALVLSVAQKIGCSHVENLRSGEYIGYLDLMRRLLEAPKLPEGQASEPRPAGGIPDAAASSARAAGAHNSPTAPERENKIPLDGELTITPVKVDQPPDGKSMVVHYRIRTGNAVRMTKIHCWDSTQFGNILDTVGKSTTFVTKETKTGFVNIVGVKR